MKIHADPKKLDALFQKLADTLSEVLPTFWTRVVAGYFIESGTGFTHQQIFFTGVAQEDWLDLVELAFRSDEYDDAVLTAGDVFGEVHRLCAWSGDNWTGMTFTLDRDGSFCADYSYEPLTDYGRSFILQWQSRYLTEEGS